MYRWGGTRKAFHHPLGDLILKSMSISLPPDDASARDASGFAERRWQFSLRTLMLWMALACGLFAILSRVGPLWSAAIIWFLILVAGHVLGAVWGSHAKRMKTSPEICENDSLALPSVLPVRFARATRLREKSPLGWIMPTVTGVAALLGATAGGFVLIALHVGKINFAGLAMGIVSAAILGGFFGFLTSSFVEVSARAFREAAREQRPVKSGGRFL